MELLKEILKIIEPLLEHEPHLDSKSYPALSSKKMECKQMIPYSQIPVLAESSKSSLQSSLAALMVTLGPYGFMILRRCVKGAEDSPLLPHVEYRNNAATRPSSAGESNAATINNSAGHLSSNINNALPDNNNNSRSNNNNNDCNNIVYDSVSMLRTVNNNNNENRRVVGLFFPPPSIDDEVISVSGAGDCLASGFIAGMLANLSVSECAAVGNTAAGLSLQASPAVPVTLSKLQAVNWAGPVLPYTLIY